MHNQEKGLIEVAPLAYMRGRTPDNAYIILDEAQNTTPAQMKMFLTRIGFGSKVIITGDKTQKDLPSGAVSGLDVAMRVLGKIDDIGFCNLTSNDVVRHPLVQKIVQALMTMREKNPPSSRRRKKPHRLKRIQISQITECRKAEHTMTINIEYETDKPLDVTMRRWQTTSSRQLWTMREMSV